MTLYDPNSKGPGAAARGRPALAGATSYIWSSSEPWLAYNGPEGIKWESSRDSIDLNFIFGQALKLKCKLRFQVARRFSSTADRCRQYSSREQAFAARPYSSLTWHPCFPVAFPAQRLLYSSQVCYCSQSAACFPLLSAAYATTRVLLPSCLCLRVAAVPWSSTQRFKTLRTRQVSYLQPT